MKKYAFTLSLIMLMVSFCLQCSKYEPTPQQIVDCFGKDGKTSLFVKPKNLVKIYIDGSYSMAGFVRQDGNSVFGQMLESLRSMILPGYSKEFYKFAGEIEPISDNDVHYAQSQRGFFGGSDTRLSDVCAKFVVCPQKDLPSAFVIVTDGVQSTPEEASDYVKVSNQINEWLLKKYAFHVLAMRSQFNGEICSETKKQMKSETYKFPYTSAEGSVKTYRPFYLYIFATDSGIVEEMISRIEPNKISPDYQLVDFSSRISREYEVEFKIPRSNPTGEEKNPFEIYTYKAKFPNIMKLDWKQKVSDKPSLPGYLKVTLKLKPSKWMKSFVRHPENIRLETECVSFSRSGSSPITPIPIVYLDSSSVGEGVGGEWTLRLWLRFKDEIPPEGWYAYHIRFLPHLHAFGPAPWVTEWSTDRDDEPKFASKTLYMQKFISCLLQQPSLTDQSLGEIYIGIRR